MPITARVAPGGMIFHVLNRGNDWRPILESAGDHLAFLRVMAETAQEVPLRILAWRSVMMPSADRRPFHSCLGTTP